MVDSIHYPKIYAIDPGAVATGVALLHFGDTFAKQFTDPHDVYHAIADDIDFHPKDAVILIEDYQSSGHLTKEAKATLKLVGAFEFIFKTMFAYQADVILRAPQARLSGQREAAELMGGTIEELKVDPHRKDAFSALSHCVTYRRTLE